MTLQNIFCNLVTNVTINLYKSTEALTCGTTKASSISAVGEQDYYTFSVTAGNAITLSLVRSSGSMEPNMVLYDSSGTTVSSTSNYYYSSTSITETLTKGGTYTLLVYDHSNDETGNYNLTLENLTNPCSSTSLTCGETKSSSISSAGEQDFYKISVSDNDSVTLSLVRSSGSMEPNMVLYDSSGTTVSSTSNYDYSSTSITGTLTKGGTYTLLVYDGSNDETGNYNLTYNNLTTPCSGTTASTTTTTGTATTTTATTTAIPTFSKYITYSLPYLHTNTNNVVYCQVSNNTASSTIGSVAVLSNSTGTTPTQKDEPTGISVLSKQTSMVTFSGSNVMSGSTNVDITTNTGNTGSNLQAVYYSAKIAFGTNDNTTTCDKIGMTCFQGTSSPRRNLLGYRCTK